MSLRIFFEKNEILDKELFINLANYLNIKDYNSISEKMDYTIIITKSSNTNNIKISYTSYGLIQYSKFRDRTEIFQILRNFYISKILNE